MTMRQYERHYAEAIVIQAPASDIFSYVDDFTHLSAHMSRPSAMMMGGSMDITVDAGRGQEIGSRVRMSGHMMGMSLAIDEVITEREVPRFKAWETVGVQQMLIIDNYRLGFEIAPAADGSTLRVFIDYNLPSSLSTRWLGYLLGSTYAKWCVRRMLNDARMYFAEATGKRSYA